MAPPARPAHAARQLKARRKHRALGAAITSALLVAIAIVVVLILANPPKYRVTPAVTNDLIGAMSSVPAADVQGSDPVVRPPGAVRSYYQQRGRVTTIMYVSRQPLDDESQAIVAALTAAGWRAPNNLPPGRVSTLKESFTGVYASNNSLLQLAITHVKDITAATYIVQGTQ
ncbi:MAG: hypothetical protein NVSMB17_12340 [Candidatus Dormibacteria bacterium]